MKYEHKTYGIGYALKVTPVERGADVMHFLITGHLLGSRALDGVTWEKVDGVDTGPLLKKSIEKE